VARVDLAPSAIRDLRKLRRAGQTLDQIETAIAALGSSEKGLDIRPLEGRAPWRRLRDGDWRILFRTLDRSEVRGLGLKGRVYVVARIVNRRDLERAVRSL
jgi:mRNA-degrading endonuclease RelE of RelBE toxin-antitoxin system